MTRAYAPVLVLVFISIIGPLAAAPPASERTRQIRTTDHRLQRLVDDGTRASDTFRRLVERLHDSTVVVYLECSGRRGTDGRLTFISSVGGYRYVHVLVAYMPSAHRQIALIGHELRHAVEIAEAPEVVDAASLAREYGRIGFVSARHSNGHGVAFDSHAAVEAGYRVLRELSGQASPPPVAHLEAGEAAY